MLHASRLRRSPWLLLVLAPVAAGQIVFEPPVTTPLAHKTQGVFHADVNLDGHADIVTNPRFETGFVNPHVSVFLGDGDGTFAPAVTTIVPGVNSSRCAVAPMDGDANPDLVLLQNVGGDEVLTVFTGHGDGSFGEMQTFVLLPFAGEVVDVVPVDVTGDGLLDVVCLNAGFFPFLQARLIVGVADGAGGFTVVDGPVLKLNSRYFALGDVNADGLLDAVISCAQAGTLSVELGLPGGHWAAPVHLAVGGAPNGLVLRDFDADGALDVAYADTSGNRVVSMHGDGAGHFATLQNVAVAGGPTELSAGLLDSDGSADLLISDASSGELSVLRGAGDGTFALVTTVSHVPAAGGSTLADWDEDGLLDAAVGTVTDPGTVAVLRNHSYGGGSPFTDLGHALAGSNGYPILLASGTLVAGSPGALDLHVAAPFASGNLWVGLGVLNKPFKGGVFVPSPLLPVPFATSGTGDASLAFLFPPGVPSGTTLVFQSWIADAGAVKGFSSSSGLLGLVP